MQLAVTSRARYYKKVSLRTVVVAQMVNSQPVDMTVMSSYLTENWACFIFFEVRNQLKIWCWFFPCYSRVY